MEWPTQNSSMDEPALQPGNLCMNKMEWPTQGSSMDEPAPQPGTSAILMNNMPSMEIGDSVAAELPQASEMTGNCVAAQNFQIDSAAIRSVPADEQAEELRALGLNVYDQTVLEEGILEQVDKAFQQQESLRQQQQAQKTLKTVQDDIRSVKVRLKQIGKALSMMPKLTPGINKDVKRQVEAILKEKENKQKQLKSLRARQRSLVPHVAGATIDADTDVESEGELDPETKFQLEQVLESQYNGETDKEKLIRLGHMTPFGTMLSSGGPSKEHRLKVTDELTDFEKYLLNQGQAQQAKKQSVVAKDPAQSKLKKLLEGGSKIGQKSATSLKRSDEDMSSQPSTSKQFPPLVPQKKRKHYKKEDVGTLIKGKDDKRVRRRNGWWPDPDANAIDLDEVAKEEKSGSEYEPSHSEGEDNELEELKIRNKIEKNSAPKVRKSKNGSGSDSDEKQPSKMGSRKLVDDGNQADYVKRLKKWKNAKLLKKHKKIANECDGLDPESSDEEEEDGFEEFEGGYRIPLSIWNKLYRYQQTCVRWLWELHSQRCGGIMGDEMGLGKTIQAIAYLVGLSKSDVCSKDGKYQGLGPVIIVAPTTVMHQWLKEFHTWWPPFRVAILHDSGSYTGTKESLVRNINAFPGILITSYSGITIHQDLLLKYDWQYILLDEGHKIRNPDARATLVCKQFRTPHRFILSGSPLQNHLKELWSLFDFIFPGKLGTLPVFMQQFAVPITHGGYSNASQVQVQTAYRCAVVLRDTITPYLLRRMKSDVKMNLNLPSKNEQVLFCRLTEEQRNLYKEYLDSKEIKSILDGRLQVFVGLINLRKICNHADLYSGGPKVFGNVDQSQLAEEMHYGFWRRSGKMVVIEAILKLWHRQKHRVLLFSQSKQMLDILERFVQIQEYSYLRMDGGTSIGSRQPLVNKFNTDSSIFVFLLTTRVGGLGVNLTGANRVVIFDPDWNPSTDMQARERAWRIGQQKDVTVYRLLTSGTIEEKIYHRQIFKQFLTNRVLKDPRQRRFFKSNDMFELFVLRDEGNEGTETSAIFAGTGSEVKVSPSKRNKSSKAVKAAPKNGLTQDKIQQMRDLAKKLSQKIVDKVTAGSSGTIEVGAEPSQEQSIATQITNGNCKTPAAKGHRQSKSHKSSKKKRRGVDIEGVQLDFLAGKDTYKSTGQDEEDKAKNAKQDEYVLARLFAKTGVHSALKHDAIIESADPDYMLVEGEAERVAKEAVKALKASRRNCYRAESGVPTWTGSHGLSGAPIGHKQKARFGQRKNTKLLDAESKVDATEGTSFPTKVKLTTASNPFETKKVFTGEVEPPANVPAMTSSQLLAKMRQRNHLNPATADDGDEERVVENPEDRLTTEYDELLVDIRNCIAFQCTVDGEASTEEILARFKDKLPARDSAVFKALLQKICSFTRNVRGDGIWRLEEEFR